MKKILILILLLGIQPAIAQSTANGPDLEKPRPPSSYRQAKQLYAHSFLYAKAPEFVVEEWIGDEPDMKGKYVLIEFWATWCSSCKRTQALMNTFQDKFGDEMVIIGVSDEPVNKVLPYIEEREVKYAMAVDQQARMKDALGVWGIPHVIIVEPNGHVIWEGFPLQEGYELKEQTIEKILEIGRRLKKQNQSQ